MEKIILDTNFLLIPFYFKVDIFSEIQRISDFKYTLFILDKTIDELDNIIKVQSGKSVKAAKFALDMIRLKKIKKIRTGDGDVDDLLLDQEAIIATQDRLLIDRLKKKGKKIIRLRQKKYLSLK